MSKMNTRRVPLPLLGPEEPRRSPAPKILVFVLVIGAAGGWWWWQKHRSASVPSVVALTPAPAPVLPVAAPSVAPDPLKQSGLQKVSLTLQGPLESALPRRNEEPIVHALRFNSGKRAQTYAAYRFKPPGAPFARYYLPSGEELEMRLRDAPLDDYEQVTSLIRDGRRHKGVDFKTPVGSQVRATFDGVITRKNWHFRANGNCLEVTERGGTHRRALFLHLSPLPKSLQLGTAVQKGEVIAASGNSGHSFAPHLHYQLMLGETRLLDPFTNHPIYRQSLTPTQKAAFEAETHRLDGLMPIAVAGK